MRRRCWRAATSTTGLPRKMSFGPWLLPAFRLLAKFKFLRGTAFDPFGRSAERRTERRLIEDYDAACSMKCWRGLRPTTIISRSALPPYRKKSAASATSSSGISTAAKADEAALLEQFREGAPQMLKAAE